jgi:hypothetical protein
MEDGMNPSAPVSIKIVQTFERDTVKYDFYTKLCSCCNNPMYFIGRTDGARISCFQISEEKIDKIESMVDELHQSFAVDITTILGALKDTISDITVSDGWKGFQTDGLSNYRIRTLDRARLIMQRFYDEGKLAHLEANADNIDDNLVSSFVLGYLASENWWVINAARETYHKEPKLRRNDSKTAQRIAQLKLPQLRKNDGTYLGEQAIIKHLRAARDASLL